MRLLLVCLALSILTTKTFAQNKLRLDSAKEPFFLVDSFQTDMKLLLLSAGKIESVTVLKDSNATATYGPKAINGAIIVKTKPDTRLLRLGQILDKYQVSPADRNLRVCINKVLVTRPELILADDSEIVGVEITEDRRWINPGDVDGKEKFVNIKTNQSQ